MAGGLASASRSSLSVALQGAASLASAKREEEKKTNKKNKRKLIVALRLNVDMGGEAGIRRPETGWDRLLAEWDRIILYILWLELRSIIRAELRVYCGHCSGYTNVIMYLVNRSRTLATFLIVHVHDDCRPHLPYECNTSSPYCCYCALSVTAVSRQ